MPKKIVLLASGNGTNAANICRFFQKDNKVVIISVFTNNPLARVIERVKEYGIKAEVFDKISFNKGDLLKTICSLNPDLIVLAGFLLKLGPDWIRTFPDKILNIHPALLPKYFKFLVLQKDLFKALPNAALAPDCINAPLKASTWPSVIFSDKASAVPLKVDIANIFSKL